MREYIPRTDLARLMKVHHTAIVRAAKAGHIKTIPYLRRQVIPIEEAKRLLEPLGISLDCKDKK